MPFELSKISDWFPGLVVESTNPKSFCITGEIQVVATFNNFSIDESFTIKITASNYPEAAPKCFETSGKISSYHVNSVGERDLCLASGIVIHKKIQKNPSMVDYINDLVIPFFISFRYFEKFGVSPFGELEHGGEGLLSEYRQHFKVDDIKLCIFLTYGTKYLYRGHHLCPCESGLLLRKCHGQLVRAIFDGYHPASLYVDIINCVNSIDRKISINHKILFPRYKKAVNILKRTIKAYDME